jgi:hypothetical protein
MSEEITQEESARRDWEAAAATAPKIDHLHMSTPDLFEAYQDAGNKMEAADMEQFVHADLAYSAAVTEMQRRDKLRDAAFAYDKAVNDMVLAMKNGNFFESRVAATGTVDAIVAARDNLIQTALWYAKGAP